MKNLYVVRVSERAFRGQLERVIMARDEGDAHDFVRSVIGRWRPAVDIVPIARILAEMEGLSGAQADYDAGSEKPWRLVDSGPAEARFMTSEAAIEGARRWRLVTNAAA